MNTRASLIFTIPIAFFLALFVILSIVPLLNRHAPTSIANATGTDLGALSGYAWSDNLGWVSFSGSNYQVAIKSDGTFYGYAWANPSDDAAGTNNIGWISFNAADTASCGPVATLTGRIVSGWAKVLSAGNGWDGCMSLGSDSYVVTLNSSGPAQSGTFDGFSWTDATVGGWLSWNCDQGGPTGNDICSTKNYAVTYTTGTIPPPPSVSITSFTGPTRVRSGNTATLTYIVTNPPANCSLNGNTSTAIVYSGTVHPVDGVQGSVTTGAITASTLFTLVCGTASQTWTVGITPTVIEK